MNQNETIAVAPFDADNRTLVENTHPAAYVNPRPADRYNLVVVGAGTAGLVSAIGAAGLGAKVALVERHLIGGDCLAFGCVPSKTLLRSSRVAADCRGAARFGVNAHAVESEFEAVMKRVRHVRAEISKHDSAARIRDAGVDLFLGEARFTARDCISVGSARLRFSRAAITTGAHAATPPIEGAAPEDILTNETVFSLTRLPRRLAVIGAGPVGCELAQAFARLGSKVSLVHMHERILNKEDDDAAGILEKRLRDEGVTLLLGGQATRLEKENGERILVFEPTAGGEPRRIPVDAILAGVGRAPNVGRLDLDAAGVAFDSKRGVHIDDTLRTTNRAVYAAGDVAMGWKFTHAADAAARLLIQNALFGGRKKLSGLNMPWCTYTNPEIAHIGLYERDAREKGIALDTYAAPLAEVDRAIADGQTEGFVRIHTKKGSSKILGATVVAADAGAMISEISVAMQSKNGLAAIAKAIHPYPTQSEALKRAGDDYTRSRLKSWMKPLIQAWLRVAR